MSRFESERFRQTDPLGLCESKHTTRTLYNKCLRRKVAAGRKQVAATKGFLHLVIKRRRKAANRVIICGAFNRERYRELINPSVVVKGAATPITQMRRTRLWQVRLYRVVGVLKYATWRLITAGQLANLKRYTTKEKTSRLVGREWSQVISYLQ